MWSTRMQSVKANVVRLNVVALTVAITVTVGPNVVTVVVVVELNMVAVVVVIEIGIQRSWRTNHDRQGNAVNGRPKVTVTVTVTAKIDADGREQR